MNDEQSKRIADAADAIVQAAEALVDARDDANDRRFESEVERERTAAAAQLMRELDAAGKRIEDAVRKAAVAGAAAGRTGAFQKYQQASRAVREGRRLARTITDQDGSANRKARGEEAISQLEEALEAAASLIFAE